MAAGQKKEIAQGLKQRGYIHNPFRRRIINPKISKQFSIFFQGRCHKAGYGLPMQYPVFIRLRILKLSQILYDDAFLPVKIRNPSLNQGKGERLKIFFLRQYAVGTPFIIIVHQPIPDIYDISTVR